MTFEEFQATRVYATDLAAAMLDVWQWDDTSRGNHYLGRQLYIEESTDPAKGRWLVIANWQKTSDDLADLERHLYAFARSEGMCPTLAEVEEIAKDARAVDTDDYRVLDRQVMTLNRFVDAAGRRMTPQQRADWDAYSLKANNDEIVDEALRIIRA